MAEIEFINKDPEQILADTIALFQTNAGVLLNQADPERLIIDVMTFREVLLRNGMEWLMRQNFVQLAEGVNLDYWGLLFGITRLTDEGDDSYRERILLANSTGGLGTKAAYKSRILSLANVADVLLFTKNDDDSLAPGRVRLIPIKRISDPVTLVSSGTVHDPALESEILAAILTDDFGVVGNVFLFAQAVPVVIDGAVNVRAAIGFDHGELLANIEYQLDRYFGQLSQSFTSEFGISGVNTYLLNTVGLQQIVSLNFPEVPVLASGEFYQRGLITINIE
jgi:hypothetical protein